MSVVFGRRGHIVSDGMDDWFERFVAEVDGLLAQIAAESDPSVLRILLDRLAAALDGTPDPALSSLSTLAACSVEADESGLMETVSRIDGVWNGWKATQIANAPGAFADQPIVDDGSVVDVSWPHQADGAGDPAASPREPGEACGLGPDEMAMLLADPELGGMFVAEALDHLSSIEALVLQLESRPDDHRLLDDVFRPFHTIKGNAGALGVTTIQECAHSVENLLDLARSGKHVIGASEIEVILQAVDVLTTMIRSVGAQMAGQAGVDVSREREAVMRAVSMLVDARPILSNSEPGVVPAPAAAAPGRDAAAAGAPSSVDPTNLPAPAPRAVSGPARMDDPLQAAVKVDTRKLDALVDAVGELVIVQSMIQVDPVLQAVDERLSRNLAQLKRITSDLQRNAMSMRMTPIRPTFQKMSRLVRDLARRSSKTIEMTLSGEDTELDRKVVEDINDPLMHMIRNSVDHGIEPAAERLAAGKPAVARVSLSAYHEGGSIVIAIADDGAGLDTDRIRAKAIAQGLIAAGAELSPAEIHQLIFMPGFSTAEAITEISGRGVGMDVVRRNIDALRGRIEIHTERGAGTTFLIKLPLTLAILEGLLLRVGDERFVLPTFSVRESMRPVADQVHPVQGRRQMIKVRESVLPLVHLGALFGHERAERDPCDTTVVVIEDNGRRVALSVDELLGKQEVVIKSLGEAFAGVKGVAGGAILGDGRIGLILDAGGLVALMDRPMPRAA